MASGMEILQRKVAQQMKQDEFIRATQKTQREISREIWHNFRNNNMFIQSLQHDFVSPDETQHNLPLPVPAAAIEKSTKRIDEMTFADYQRGVAAVFDTYKLGN